MLGSIDGQGVGAYLVGCVAVGCDAVRPDHHCIHPPLRHQRGRRGVHDERGRQPVMYQLVRGQPGPYAPGTLLTVLALEARGTQGVKGSRNTMASGKASCHLISRKTCIGRTM